jgi:hypothetical protein
MGSKNEQLKAKTYESSAHVFKIGFRAKKINETDAAKLQENFLLIHKKYVHPNYVMRDNITLMGVAENTAFFVALPPEVDVFSSDLHPFMYVTQFRHATHIIVMPMTSFHRLSEEVGDPEADVVLLSNTGRCGSTLLAQVFEAIPSTIVMSEPDAYFLAFMMHSTGKTTDEEDEMILKSITRLQCKHTKCRKVERIVLKTRAPCVQQMKKISVACRFTKHLFMYRHPRDTILSFIAANGPDIKYLTKEVFVNNMSLPETSAYRSLEKNRLLEGLSVYGSMALMWAMRCICFLEYRREGLEILSLMYEELLNNPSGTVSKMFLYLNVPKQHVPQALTALQRDSQRNSQFGKNKIAKYKQLDFTAAQLREVNYVLSKAGFPSINEFTNLTDWNDARLA